MYITTRRVIIPGNARKYGVIPYASTETPARPTAPQLQRQDVRQNSVHAQAEVSLLFCAAQWQDSAIVALQIIFHHPLIHFADPHSESSSTDSADSRRFV
jgi:hypothetical protein